MTTTSEPTSGTAAGSPDPTRDVAMVAEAFFAAIEAGDTATLVELYHPDARIWHNYDQLEQTVGDNMKTLGYLVRTLQDRRYEEVRRVVLDDGFVQQHVLRGSAPGGALEMPAMMRVWVSDGRVTRIEEYLDPAPTSVFRRPA